MWLRKRKAAAVKSEPRPVPTPEPVSATDPQAALDRELEERKRASHEVLAAKILRDGTDGVGFSDGGLTRAERADRLFGWGRG